MIRFLPRFTVRRLLAAVAIAALLLAAVVEFARLAQRRAAFQGRVAMHAREMAQMSHASNLIFKAREKVEREGIVDPTSYFGLGPRIPAPYSLLSSYDDRRNKYLFRWKWHKRMKAKYERATERPWLAVEPDTIEPR